MMDEGADSFHGEPCRLLVRSKKSLEIYSCPDQQGQTTNQSGITVLKDVSTTFQSITPDGSNVFVHITGRGIVKISLKDTSRTSTTPFFANTANVQMMCLSPAGTFAVTWERWYEDKCPKNLKIWNINNGELVASFMQKSISRESWPLIKWTADERYIFFLYNSSQIRIYDSLSASQAGSGEEPRYVHYLPVKSCSSFTVPEAITTTTDSQSYYFSTFVPVQKDKPASATVHQYTPTAGADSSSCFTTVASKSLFQAESCSAHWSPAGDGVIVTLQTDVDATGKSYYGSSRIFLWNANNVMSPKEFLMVDLPQENGPVLAVKWVPKLPANFIVIAGQSPAMSSLHNGVTGKAVFQFGNNVHRNTVDIAPHGRFFVLGGFGNLAGSLSFWDVNKKKLLPHVQSNVDMSLRAEAVTCHEWSPSSRLFVVATCSPRMNVDNGIRLYKYTGEQLTNVPWDNKSYNPDQLLQVAFIPAASTVYPDRPQSPPPERPIASASVSTLQQAPSTAASGNGKYIPPSARRLQTGGGVSLAERLRQEKQGSIQTAGKVVVLQKGPISALTGRVIPGLAAPTAIDKNKNAIKREKQKLKKQQEAIAATNVPSITAVALSDPTTNPAPQQATAEDYEKRSRKLKKSLKQIEELKLKDPKTLNEDQKQKLASEPILLKELEQCKSC